MKLQVNRIMDGDAEPMSDSRDYNYGRQLLDQDAVVCYLRCGWHLKDEDVRFLRTLKNKPAGSYICRLQHRALERIREVLGFKK